MNMLEFGAPMPNSLGGAVDLYHDLRELRLMQENLAETTKRRETEVQDHIINNLSKSAAEGGNTGVAGQRYRAQIVVKEKFNAIDWGILHSWIRKNDRFDMLQKRLSDTAVKDFVDQEQRLLPGTERVNVPTVSVTKI